MLVRIFSPGECVVVEHVPSLDRLLVGNSDQIRCRIAMDGARELFRIAPAQRKLQLERRPAHHRERLRHWIAACPSDEIRADVLRAMELVLEENRHLLLRRWPR